MRFFLPIIAVAGVFALLFLEPSEARAASFVSNADASLCVVDFTAWSSMKPPLNVDPVKFESCQSTRRTRFFRRERNCNRSARTSRTIKVQSNLCRCMQSGLNSLVKELRTRCKFTR
jgi:hypothetical protein